MGQLMSWRPINFDRWTALACAVAAADPGARNDLMSAIPRLRLSWERLRDDLRELFQPSGPAGTHAHHHYHPPFGPAEHHRVLTACVADYESALLFLDVALDASAHGVGTVAGIPVKTWRHLVRLAEEHDGRITQDLADRVLYLQRTVLYARNKAIAHPGGQLAKMSYDNVGNAIFWRSPTEFKPSLISAADELLHKIRPDLGQQYHVGTDIPPYLAHTWIATRAAELEPDDRRRFEDLRVGLGYWLPGPYEIAENVNTALDELIALIPADGFGAIALRGRVPASARALAAAEADEITAPTEDPRAGIGDIERAVSLGEAGRLEDARSELATIVAEHPQSAIGHLAMAETLHKMKRYREAIEHYRLAKAIGVPGAALDDGLADSHFNLAATAYNAGDLGTAVAYYDAAVRLQPDHGVAHGHLALAQARQGEVDAALLNAELALVRHGDQPEVRFDVGLALMACGNAEAALENLTVATELRPSWAEAHAQRGVVLAKLDRLDEAKQALAAALAADPGHEPARTSLAVLESTRPADR